MSIGAGGGFGLLEQETEVVGDGSGSVFGTGIHGLSFSRTAMSRVPNNPGLSQFLVSRQSGQLRGHPVPHTLSQEHSTSVLLLVLSKIVFSLGF